MTIDAEDGKVAYVARVMCVVGWVGREMVGNRGGIREFRRLAGRF